MSITRFYRDAGKRLIDFTLALIGLIVLAPVLLVTALLVRIKLGSPVIFRQQRPGLRGKPFLLFKFRSMTDARDATGALLSDEARLPAFGRFLRGSSLDELPELINVLKGEMSLVGPRPLLMEYLNHYTPAQMRRHEMRPGVTGWAQINGRNLLSWEKRFELDIWYVDHVSPLLDLKILLLTLKKVVVREGISAEGSATMPHFTGSPKESL